MTSRTYDVRLQDGFKIESLSTLSATNIRVWHDATDAQVKEHGSSSAVDLMCYKRWVTQVNGFLKLSPLEFAESGTTDFKPLYELYRAPEHSRDDGYLLDCISNFANNVAVDATKDAINLDSTADNLLHTTIGMRLEGHKNADWCQQSSQDASMCRVAVGVKNVRETILGSIKNVRSEAKDEFEKLTWDDKTSLPSFRERFKNQFNNCENLGVKIDFDTARRVWMRAITQNRSGMTFLLMPLENPRVVAAIDNENLSDFVLRYCETVKKYIKNKDQVLKHTRGEGTNVNFFTGNGNFPSNRQRGNGRGAGYGRGSGYGRGNGRGGGRGGRGFGRGNWQSNQQFSNHNQFNQPRCGNCNRSHRANDPCPAFGRNCNNCGKLNHFASACRSPSIGHRNASAPQQSRYQGAAPPIDPPTVPPTVIPTQQSTMSRNQVPSAFSTRSIQPSANRQYRTEDASGFIANAVPNTTSVHFADPPVSHPRPRMYSFYTAVQVSEPVDITVDTNTPTEESEISVGSPFHPDQELFIAGSTTPDTEVDSGPLERSHQQRDGAGDKKKLSSILWGWALLDTAASNHSFALRVLFFYLYLVRSVVITNMGTYITEGLGGVKWRTRDDKGRRLKLTLHDCSFAPDSDAPIISYCRMEDDGFFLQTSPHGRFLTDGRIWI